MGHLTAYLTAHQNDNNLSTEAVFKSITSWLSTSVGLASGGIFGMFSRADINIRLRTGMAAEMQRAFIPGEHNQPRYKICGGCADEIFCVSCCLRAFGGAS